MNGRSGIQLVRALLVINHFFSDQVGANRMVIASADGTLAMGDMYGNVALWHVSGSTVKPQHFIQNVNVTDGLSVDLSMSESGL